jgi:glycosyltransferase involved in cell wall biosynthesis
VEILGDPADALSRGSLRHPARMLLRRLACAELRWACDRACATAYVTRSALQRRYPPRPGCFTTQVSSVELDDDDFAAARPDRRPPHDAVAIVHVGTFSQPYKGQDLILDAVRTLARSGVHVRATLIGEGRHRPALEVRARASGLEAQVEFTGEIRERAELRRRLDAADLFVFPSRAEGLPRALIEAMARGLPCVATAVGGIRELLPPEALCPVGDADALAARIAAVARDRESARRMAEANLATAREYHRSVLRPRAQAFQERLREETAAWHRARSGR